MAAKQTKPILDTKTGKEYTSMYSAGKELGTKLVPNYTGAARLIWFAMTRAFPDRFKTKNPAGEWVSLTDPSVPKVVRQRKTETDDQKRARLLAELGEIDQRRAAGTATVATAKNGKNTPAAAAQTVAADADDGGVGEELEAEIEAPAAPAKPKLGTAMRQTAKA